jgi:tetratricopeptide (TPR) repeat protein
MENLIEIVPSIVIQRTTSIRLFLFIIILFFSLSDAAAQVSPDSLLKLTHQERFAVMNRMHGEAMKIGRAQANLLVNNLKQYFEKEGTAEDQLLLRVCMITKGPEKPELFEGKVLNVLKEAERLQNSFMMAKAHHILGLYYYYKQRRYGAAFQHLLTMVDLIKESDEVSYPGHTYAIYFTARAHYDFFDYENTIKYGQILTRVKDAKVKDTHIFNACMMGMAYLNLNQYDLAKKSFEWGLRYVPSKFPAPKQVGWNGIFNGNIGLIYYQQKDYEKAIAYLQKGINLTQQAEHWDNVSRFSSKLALIYLEQRQLKKASLYAQQALQAAGKISETAYEKKQYQIESYKVMADSYRALGQYKLSLLYTDSATVSDDLWKQQIDVTLKHRAEIAVEQERHLAQERLLQKEKERQTTMRNGLIVFFLMTILIAYLLYNRQRLLYRHRHEQLLAEKQLTTMELEGARAQLEQFRQEAHRKSLWMEQLANEWDYSPHNNTILTTKQEVLSEIRNSVILTDRDWSTFVQLFEKVHPNFFERLRAKFPDLSPAETRFIALSRLSYANREMAAMLGVGMGAIRQYRLRIRRKLLLSEEVNLEQIIAEI